MGNEEFIVSSVKAEDEYIVVAFTVSNSQERLHQLVEIAKKKWLKQYGGRIPLPDQYKAQIIGNGIPPMLMRFPMAAWNNKNIHLNDKVLMNVPQTIEDVMPVKKDDFGV